MKVQTDTAMCTA